MIKKNLRVFKTLMFLFLITISLTLFFGCSSSGKGSKKLVVVAEGTELVLYGLNNEGDPTEIGRAEIPPAGLMYLHAIFGITKHPTEPWFYVGSLNECSQGDDGCWGNGRIDRFRYSSSGISYDGLAFDYDFGSGPACADSDSVYVGQTGNCAPTTIAFSSDGLRAYVDDDDDDVLQIFSVNPGTGDWTYLWEGANTSLNGLTVSPDDGYLYNGSSVIDIIGDTASDLLSGTEGNATEIVTDAGGDDLLVTTEDNDTFAIYDLLDQSAPALIDSILLPQAPTFNCISGGGQKAARFQASSADLSIFVVVGAESVATVSFNGTELRLLDQVFDIDDSLDVINRGVAVTPDGKYALVTWFIPWDNSCDALLTGGMTVYRIEVNGDLTELGTEVLTVPSRAVLGVTP